MLPLIRCVLCAAVLVCSIVPPVSSNQGTQHAASQPVSAMTVQIVKMDGEVFVVRDQAGKELRLHVSPDTEIFGQIKAGDLVQVWVRKDGHVRTVMIERSAPQPAP